MLKRVALTVCAVAAVAVPATLADPVEDFYKGKTVNLIIGYPPGGGYDVYARVIARHIGKHIPGQPTVVPQNMPGAGSLKAANYLYGVAPKDGTVFGMFSRNIPLLGVIGGNKNVEYDPTKFTWLGSPTSGADDAYILWYRTDAGVNSIEEARKPGGVTLLLGGTAPGSTGADVPKILHDTIGIRIKQILGYPGSDQLFLAIERKEIMGRMTDYSSVTSAQSQWLDPKVMTPLVQFARETRHPKFPNVPTARELAKDKEALALIELAEGPFEYARPVAAPPGVPPERAKALQKAFMDMHKDPDYLAEATKVKIEISPIDGNRVAKLIGQLANADKKQLDYMRDLINAAAKAKKEKKGEAK